MGAMARDNGLKLHSVEDALEIIWSGLPNCILTEDDLAEDLLDLRNGLAGEAFQKFVNYGFPVALVLPDPGRFGPRVEELAREHASHPCVRICRTVEEAHLWLGLDAADPPAGV